MSTVFLPIAATDFLHALKIRNPIMELKDEGDFPPVNVCAAVKKCKIHYLFSCFIFIVGMGVVYKNGTAKAAFIDCSVFAHWFAAFPVHAHSLHTNLAFG